MWERIVPDFKCKRNKFPVSYVHGPHFADFAVLHVLRYLQDGFGLVVQFRADMSSRVIVSLVQVQHRMYMQLVVA